MDERYIIEQMTKDEVGLALSWAAREGWNPGLQDRECFYLADPHGFFAGKLNGKIIALGSAIIYDPHFAFCGFYIVDKAFRGQGYGLKLTKARLAYVGNRNAGIDGVTDMLDKYARLGYKRAHSNARYYGHCALASVQSNASIIPLVNIPFEALLNYDRKHFPAKRAIFLKCWINQTKGVSLGYVREGKLCGYGVIRACQQGFKIAPLFADDEEIADQLFLNLAHYAKDSPIYLDIPENNPAAIALVKRYQLEKVFETARMYLKEPPNIATKNIYGITSFELG